MCVLASGGVVQAAERLRREVRFWSSMLEVSEALLWMLVVFYISVPLLVVPGRIMLCSYAHDISFVLSLALFVVL